MKKRMIGMLVAMVLLAGFAEATTTNTIYDGTSIPAEAKKTVTLIGDVNFATTPATAAGDTYKVVAIPSNCVVLAVGWKVVTTNGPTTAITVGDQTTTNKWQTGIDGAAYTMSANVTNSYYSAADYVAVSVSQAVAGGKVRITAVVCPLEK